MSAPKGRILAGYIIAVAVAIGAATLLHSVTVIARLLMAGADIPTGTRGEMIFGDFIGLAPTYGAAISIALALGFWVAAMLKRVLTVLAPIAYPLAGAAAVAATLVIMGIAFEGITPIAGARGELGFSLQCFAGALGGLVFSMIAPRAVR